MLCGIWHGTASTCPFKFLACWCISHANLVLGRNNPFTGMFCVYIDNKRVLFRIDLSYLSLTISSGGWSVSHLYEQGTESYPFLEQKVVSGTGVFFLHWKEDCIWQQHFWQKFYISWDVFRQCWVFSTDSTSVALEAEEGVSHAGCDPPCPLWGCCWMRAWWKSEHCRCIYIRCPCLNITRNGSEEVYKVPKLFTVQLHVCKRKT